jgi:hypothetical protein
MRTTQTIFLSGAVLVGVAGLALSEDKSGPAGNPRLTAPHEEQAAVSAAAAKSAADFPIIGYIEKRGRTITIKAGPKGPVYSVKTSEGKVLFENLSGDQLRAQAPELHEFLKSAVAGGTGKGGVVQDASVRSSAIH